MRALRYTVKRDALLALGAMVACWLMLSGGVDAKNKDRGDWLRLSPASSRFWNYDYDVDERINGQQDWPVDLIFYNNASLTKARAAVGYDLDRPGRPEYGFYKKTPSAGHHAVSDKGTKSACYGHHDTHFRVYARLRDDDTHYNQRLYVPESGWRYFVFGSSHVDFREGICDGGNGQWHGRSEHAEARVAQAARDNGCTVWDNPKYHPATPKNKYERVWAKNFEDIGDNRRRATHIWENDAWATQIRIPDAADPC